MKLTFAKFIMQTLLKTMFLIHTLVEHTMSGKGPIIVHRRKSSVIGIRKKNSNCKKRGIDKKEQKSGLILTSTVPNIFRMLFSVKNQTMWCCKPTVPFVGKKNPSSPWNIATASYYWKRFLKTFSVITSRVNILWRGRVFWHTKGTGGLQHHDFLIFDRKQQPKNIYFRGC